ncbi:10536_t:CDS:2, partial [Ambispora leptoticha]
MATVHNLKGTPKNKPPLKESNTTATNIANSDNKANLFINNDPLYDFDAPKYRTFNEDSTYGEGDSWFDKRLGTPASPLITKNNAPPTKNLFVPVIASSFLSKPPLPTLPHKSYKENNATTTTHQKLVNSYNHNQYHQHLAPSFHEVYKLDVLTQSPSTKQKTNAITHHNNHHHAKGKKLIENPSKIYDEFKVDPSDTYNKNQKFQLEPVRNSKNTLDQLHRSLGIKKKNPCDDPLYNFEAPRWGDFNKDMTFGSGDSWFDRHLPTPGQSLINTSKASVAPAEPNTKIISTIVPDIKNLNTQEKPSINSTPVKVTVAPTEPNVIISTTVPDLNPQEKPSIISTPVSADEKEQNLPKKSSVISTPVPEKINTPKKSPVITPVPKKINTPKKLLVKFTEELSEKEESDSQKKSFIISTPVPIIQKKEPRLPTPYPKQKQQSLGNTSPIENTKAIVQTQKRQIVKKRKSPLRSPPIKVRDSLTRRKSRGVQKRQPILHKNVTIPKPFKFHSTSRTIPQEKRTSYVPLAAQVQRFYNDRFKSSTMKLVNHVNKNTIKAPRPPLFAKTEPSTSSRHDL